MSAARYVTKDVLAQELKRLFPSFQEERSWFFDSLYYTYDLEDILAVYNAWRSYFESHKMRYLPECFDCDDFAWDFCEVARNTLLPRFQVHMGSIKPALAIGKLYDPSGEFLGFHAWNLILQSRPTPDYPLFLWHVEPQCSDLWPAPYDRSRDGFKYELAWVVW